MTLREIASVYGLSDNEQDIFNEYTMNRFAGADEMESPDTSFLGLWEEILLYAKMYGADKAINDNICSSRPVIFNSPDKVKIRIYGAYGGRIPIIYVRDTADFEQLVTNIAYKGIRPDNISETGASFIYGKTTRFIILSDHSCQWCAR